eukprot:s1702_g5.t1
MLTRSTVSDKNQIDLRHCARQCAGDELLSLRGRSRRRSGDVRLTLWKLVPRDRISRLMQLRTIHVFGFA